MSTSRRLRSRRRNAHLDHDDLQAALATAESLQRSIRHGDGKIASLATVVCGSVVLGADHAVALMVEAGEFGTRAVGGVLAVVLISTAAMAAWHLIFAIRPDVNGPAGPNRFGYPAILRSRTLPSPADTERRRAEAWLHVATLASIAMRKHSRVRRSLPWVVLVAVSTTLLLTVARLLPFVFG